MAFDGDQFPDYSRNWRVLVLHYFAKALGVLIKVDGIPYGSRRRIPVRPNTGCGQASAREGWAG
jgi:hypothetical protein